MDMFRFIKNKLTKKGNIVSKWVCTPYDKDYSDFELLEKSVGVMKAEDWKLKKGEKELSIEEFVTAVWQERMTNEER